MKIPFYKRLFSYLVPITLEKTIGSKYTLLFIQLYLNQFLLVTPRAIYSYGTKYDPFKKPFAFLKNDIKEVKTFLLLGTGLGSAVKILQEKYNLYPDTVCIDNDEDVLKFSIKYMGLNTQNNVEWKCEDAEKFIATNKKKYDLIGVDLFTDLVMPSFVITSEFISQCRQTLTPNGFCIINLILEDDNEIVRIERKLKPHFSKVKFILDKINTYFICYA